MDVVGAHRLRPGEPELIVNPSPAARRPARGGGAGLRLQALRQGARHSRLDHPASPQGGPRRGAIPSSSPHLGLRGRRLLLPPSPLRLRLPHGAPARLPLQCPASRGRPRAARHDGSTHHCDSARNERWFSFGSPVLAAAAGTVVDARPDSRRLDLALLKTDRMAMFGNHVVVKLETGELALYAHLRQGSVRCKVGDRLRPRQQLGRSPHRVARRSPISTSSSRPLPTPTERAGRCASGASGASAVDESTAVSAGRLDIGQIVESVPVGR